MIAFGPVPSRRLGKSLGINNIKGIKTCTYACVYCQVGNRSRMKAIRQSFYEPDTLIKKVRQHLDKLPPLDKPDYLTFVSNGEPTLDLNLGREIEGLADTGIPVAVITNASMLSDHQVREEISKAAWVSVKVDAGEARARQRINRPLPVLPFDKHLEGLLQFSSEYRGVLVTETMLAAGYNDSREHLAETAQLVRMLNPKTAYIAIPIRPPAVTSVVPPAEKQLVQAFALFSEAGLKTEYLTGFEGTGVSSAGDIVNDLLNILAVHPLREDSLEALLRQAKEGHEIVEKLIGENRICRTNYLGHVYYTGKFMHPTIHHNT